MSRLRLRVLGELGSGAPLAAVCLLLANDHQGKRLFHNDVTGKVSDLAICFLLPLLVSAALGLVRDWPIRLRLRIGAWLTMAVFTLLELSDRAGALFVWLASTSGLGGGALTRDPTDLLSLACVPLAVAYGRRQLVSVKEGISFRQRLAGAVVLVTGSLALMATSPAADGECVSPAAPVMFQAEAGCGPGGLITIERDGKRARGLQISDAAPLGLPPLLAAQPLDNFRTGASYLGGACPFTLDKGDWEVSVRGAKSRDSCLDGGVDARSTSDACALTTLQTCRAEVNRGELWFVCREGDGTTGTPTCRPRLTAIGS